MSADPEYFRILIENATDVISVLEADGTIRYESPSITAVLGYEPPELVGCNAFAFIHPEDLAAVRLIFEHAASVPGSWGTGEFRFRHKDGTWRVLSGMGKNLLNDTRVAGVVVSSRDVTERREAEEELRETNRRLASALAELRSAEELSSQHERLQSLGTMASGVAHDFNNALTCILGFSELLLASPEKLADRPVALRYLQFINTSAKDAGAVVNRLRSFYRPREKGDLLVRVELGKLVEEAVSLTEPCWKAQAEARGVHIEVRCERHPVSAVEGDPAAVREALTNLIFNAVDAMPRGGTITIRLSMEDAHAVLEVSDTGTGMTDQVRRHCLEPFFTTKGNRGTGLGLPMVYGVMQRHGGTLDIRSELGVGSSFLLRFPIPPPEVERADASVAPLGADRPALNVLIVDDQAGVRAVLSEYLRMDGHHVELASDGVDALFQLAQRRYELIIIDRAMPIMGGDELAEHVKAHYPRLPVIMVTGFGAMMEAAGEVPQGVDLVLAKPITADTLRAAIRQVVPQSQPSPRA